MQLKSTLVTSKPASLADPRVGIHGVLLKKKNRQGDSPVWSDKKKTGFLDKTFWVLFFF
jgi:hypothetical protein